MNTNLETEINKYQSALVLSRVLPRKAMKRLRFLFATLFATALGLTLLLQNNLLPAPIISTTDAIGLCLIFGALWVEQICLYAYHNWHYFRDLDSIIGQNGKHSDGVTYDVAETFSNHKDDTTRSFLLSRLGETIIERLEISPAAVGEFLASKRTKMHAKNISLASDCTTSLEVIAEQLYELDKDWSNTLNTNGVSKELYLETVKFVEDISTANKRLERWWSRDALSHVVGIGSELAYGNTPFVTRFSQPLLLGAIFSGHTGITPYTTYHANNVLQILAYHSASNVIIIGAVGVGKMDIVYNVAHLLTYGKGLHALHGHHVIVIDTERLLTLSSDSETLEEQVIRFFEEALSAGNITLVIPSLETFILGGEERGLLMADILDRYLAYPLLHVIAIDTPESRHTVLNKYKSILRRFEEIVIEPSNPSDTLNLLKATSLDFESKSGKMISYPALMQIHESAERYLTDGVMPDRAISLLERIFDTTTDSKINTKTVTNYVCEITGLEIGPINEEERGYLLNLENILSFEVTGQAKAVEAVANTLRRVRIDTNRSDKPKGSFLFLGPTGVGKTEMAKTLAYIYTKNKEAMVRFDMSEFSHVNALENLIGNKKGRGMLTEKLREHPFCVILFDEFEKAHSSVHDLFLQILDEGYYTTTDGERVDARNTIVIATSNAGSTLISQMTNSPVLAEELIRHLIDTNVYRPELLNRFDETIIFNPLTTEASRYIIQKNLIALTERLHKDSYTLKIDEDVVEILLVKGFSLDFGARQLQRAIQDLVESEIARQIILKNIKRGGTVHISGDMIKK